jgi:pimeloyl-ACP methyl ester carboxylesterase
MKNNSEFDNNNNNNNNNVNGVDIAYQLHGNPLHPTVLLIHGLSTPLTGWPSVMVKLLVAANFQVLLLDNRDVGRSQQFDHLPIPNMGWVITKLKLGLSIKTPYQLEDMMQDTVALLDALKLPEVHVMGASMGGMIWQLMAIMTASNRQNALSKLGIPSLVIHGDRDGLVNLAGGKATADAIPNAKLKIHPGMGHDLPVELIPNIVDDIVVHVNTNNGERT